jgi:hypothetical protein
MQFITYRELRNLIPSALSKRLTNEGELVSILNNRPLAVMISLEDENAQDIVQVVSRLSAQIAVRSIRSQARGDRLNKMTLRDVNALIKKQIRH